MGLFTFDEQYPFFDVTPVDNLFIQEYLPNAKGDYVRVYLYGLMHTYHRQKDMTLSTFARDLSMTELDVENAFRYWERRGLVQKTADNPVSYRYLSAKQVLLSGKPVVDEKYEEFAVALSALFGTSRKLHGSETRLAFEWVEELHLPQDVVLELVQFLIQTRGKQFSFQAAQKHAAALADEKTQNAEDAKAILARKKAVYDGLKKVLRRLGKRRAPSEDELDLYEKWLTEYGFKEEAILEACRETVKGDPTMAYLDGILRGIMSRAAGQTLPQTKRQMASQLDGEKTRGEPLKELYRRLGLRQAPITHGTLAMYDQMLAVAPQEIIYLAADECARTGGKMDDVMQLITSWQNKGLDTPDKVREYIALFNRQNAFLSDMYTLWGSKGKPTASDRAALSRWTNTYGFSEDALCIVAPYAEHKERPVAYMEAILKSFHEKGIKEPGAMHESLKAFRNGQKPTAPAALAAKVLSHQSYEQREYQEDDLKELKALLEKENRQ